MNNYVNEDDILSANYCRNSDRLARSGRIDRTNELKEHLKRLLTLLEAKENKTTGNTNQLNNRLTSRTEVRNLFNSLKSEHKLKQLDEEYKTPTIEEFMTNEDSNDSYSSSPLGHDWNNSELNYYKKEIYEI